MYKVKKIVPGNTRLSAAIPLHTPAVFLRSATLNDRPYCLRDNPAQKVVCP
jgi:hypothetical protein